MDQCDGAVGLLEGLWVHQVVTGVMVVQGGMCEPFTAHRLAPQLQRMRVDQQLQQASMPVPNAPIGGAQPPVIATATDTIDIPTTVTVIHRWPSSRCELARL